MLKTIEGRKVEVVKNKEIYVGSECTGLSETYEVEVIESHKKKFYVHCDPSENMNHEDVIKLVSDLYTSEGAISVDDDSIFDVTVR